MSSSSAAAIIGAERGADARGAWRLGGALREGQTSAASSPAGTGGWCRKMGRDIAEIPLAIESLKLWERMPERTGVDVGFRKKRHPLSLPERGGRCRAGKENGWKQARARSRSTRGW